MKFKGHFKNLLEQTVNLPQSRLEQLEGRVSHLHNVLKDDKHIGEIVEEVIPQGSWAHGTIIKPQRNTEYDADVLLEMRADPEWAADKRLYLSNLNNALKRAGYSGKTERRSRCVRVQYANDSHIDIVPYVQTEDGRSIVNYDENSWEESNPDGFTAWMRQQDDLAGGNLRKVIRLMKFLRDYRGSFTGTRSIILTTLLGERVSWSSKMFGEFQYEDVPSTLLQLMMDLDSWMQARPQRPSVSDPSNPNITFDHRWSDESYYYFRDRIHSHAQEMRKAFEDVDSESSEKKWQLIFGTGFCDAGTINGGPSLILPSGYDGLSVQRPGRAG